MPRGKYQLTRKSGAAGKKISGINAFIFSVTMELLFIFPYTIC